MQIIYERFIFPVCILFQGPDAVAHFEDEREIRGFQNALNNLTWAAALVDYDMDGDVDLFLFDGKSPGNPRFKDRGFVNLWENDGTGHFVSLSPEESGLNYGSSMGFGFGDFNCDGNMDFFTTRVGAFMLALIDTKINPDVSLMDFIIHAQSQSTTFFFGLDNGSFFSSDVLPGPRGRKIYLPFGWGSAAVDIDNDGDQDVLYVGGIIVPMMAVAIPAVALENLGCSGVFQKSDALPRRDYNEFGTNGLSTGDLNNDGFVDFVVTAGKWVGPPQTNA